MATVTIPWAVAVLNEAVKLHEVYIAQGLEQFEKKYKAICNDPAEIELYSYIIKADDVKHLILNDVIVEVLVRVAERVNTQEFLVCVGVLHKHLPEKCSDHATISQLVHQLPDKTTTDASDTSDMTVALAHFATLKAKG